MPADIILMKINHVKNRFYVKTAGGHAILLYRINDNVMSMHHTFVPEKERGKGIANELASVAFDFAKKNKLKVSPDCYYIKQFVERHKELKELIVK